MDCDDDFSVLWCLCRSKKTNYGEPSNSCLSPTWIYGSKLLHTLTIEIQARHLEHLETVVFGVLFEPALYLSWYSRDLNVVFYNVAKMTIPWTQFFSSAFKSSQFSSFSAEIQFKVNLQMWRWVLFFEMGTCMQIWCKYSLAGRGGFTKFIQL